MTENPKLKKQLSEDENQRTGQGDIVEGEERIFWVKGYKLKALRTSKNMSLRQFAEYLTNKTGIVIDHKYVDRWERSAKFSVDLETMEAIINLQVWQK